MAAAIWMNKEVRLFILAGVVVWRQGHAFFFKREMTSFCREDAGPQFFFEVLLRQGCEEINKA
jgi:hypothetical protein